MISLIDFWQKLYTELKQDRAVMLCLIVEKHGSAPRGVGAHMLVLEDSSTVDTIGGGALEFQSKEQAIINLKTKKSSLEYFALTNNEVIKGGMICGGQIKVLLKYLSKGDLPQIEKGLALINANEQMTIAIDWLDKQFNFAVWAKSEDFKLKEQMQNQHQKSLLCERECSGSYREIFAAKPELFLFGGGYVSQEIAKLLPAVEFAYTLIEERAEFANKTLFPHAKKIVCIDNYADFAQKVNIKPSDFALVVTSGHQKDTAVLYKLLQISPAYIGAIGSRHKRVVIGKYLKEHDFTDDQINQIHLPVGLSIGAQTPAEIAISIVAQLIEYRAK